MGWRTFLRAACACAAALSCAPLAQAQGRASFAWDASRGCPSAERVGVAFARLGLSGGLTRDLRAVATVVGERRAWHLHLRVAYGPTVAEQFLGASSCDEAALLALRYVRLVARHLARSPSEPLPAPPSLPERDAPIRLPPAPQREDIDLPPSAPPRTPLLLEAGLGVIGQPALQWRSQPLAGDPGSFDAFVAGSLDWGLVPRAAARVSVRLPLGDAVFATVGVAAAFPLVERPSGGGLLADASLGVRLAGAAWSVPGWRVLASLGGMVGFTLGRHEIDVWPPGARLAFRVEYPLDARVVVSAETSLHLSYVVSGDAFLGVGFLP